MKTTVGRFVAALAIVGLAMTVQAAEPGTRTDHTIRFVSLRNPRQKWNWVTAPSPVPMPDVQTGKAGQAVTWEYRDAAEDKKSGHRLTLRFSCANPAMELTSVWLALPGPGPVENEVFIENKSGENVVFPATLAAARINLTADNAVILHRARKTSAGVGEVLQNVIVANADFRTDSSLIPFLLLGVGEKHGAYMGYEWELGGFRVASAANPQDFTVSVFPVTENVTRVPGAVFAVPSVYYGTYQGDLDDGANRFKRWFWNYRITRSLHDNENEPWSEVCMQDVSSPSGNAGVVGTTPQSVYDRLAATGVECVKMDFWDGSGNKAIRLKGLTAQGVYTLTFQERTDISCVRTGPQLMTNGIYVTGMTGANASEIIWIEETPKARLTPEVVSPTE
jgi:hypothetical protein